MENSIYESIVKNVRYYSDNENKKSQIEKKINISKENINDKIFPIFNYILYTEQSVYWDKAVYNQVYDELSLIIKNNSIVFNEDFIEYFLYGYNSYKQITEIMIDMENMNLNDPIKTRLYRFPTYISILESILSNLYRAIITIIQQTTTKTYNTNQTLSPILEILKKYKFNLLVDNINCNYRNSINHGGANLFKDKIHFHYNENKITKEEDVEFYIFDKEVNIAYDTASAVILAIATILNNNINLLEGQNITSKSYADFNLFALELSKEGIECLSISDNGNDKQINVNIKVQNTNRVYIGEQFYLILYLVYEKFKKYDQYMIFVSSDRMLTGHIRMKNTQIQELIAKTKDIGDIYQKLISEKELVIFDASENNINLNSIKFHTFPSIQKDSYKIRNIADASINDRKRLKADIFINEVTEKKKIIEIIKKVIEEIKFLENPPCPFTDKKYGKMEADSIYLKVYKEEGRNNKTINMNNENFICMVDYNKTGNTTLKNGGIIVSLWNSLYHEKINQISIAWRNKNYKPLKIGRNDKCTCGSSKKYKHCCGKNN